MIRSAALMPALLLVAPVAAQTCGDWSRVPMPSPGPRTNLLLDVAATGPDLAIAVGNSSDGIIAPQPLVARWNGAAWSQLALPDTSALGAMPTVEGIGRSPNGGLWVVGYVRTSYPTDQMPLILPWRAGGWDEPVSPTLRPQTEYPYAARGGLAYDVTATSANDVWVVGAAVGYGDARATTVPLALHFDGSHWVDVPVPSIGNRHHSLDCVSASAPDNVWAVGDWRNVGGQFQALIVRWNGSSWSHVPNPGEGPSGGDAEAVLALAPDNVWVSGSFNGGSARLIHWNGSVWQIPTTGISGVVASFASTGPNDIWAADATFATLYHSDGSTWSAVPTPAIPGSAYVLRGWGMDAFDACGVWAVGGYSDGSTQFTLAEHLEPASCAADFNTDSTVDSQDLFSFFDAFFTGNADFNGDLTTDSQDYFDFLDAFFTGC